MMKKTEMEIFAKSILLFDTTNKRGVVRRPNGKAYLGSV
ncbi:MAG: hypothetical protein ALAOOOJD_00269 [bacterium]|nr:hypothetical protein [bacterium]